MITGLHIEGPFLSPDGYPGAHPLDAIHPANADEMRACSTPAADLYAAHHARAGTRCGFLRYALALGARHRRLRRPLRSDARPAARGARRRPVDVHSPWKRVPEQMHRHDNVMQRVLTCRDTCGSCFIADGVHVPFVRWPITCARRDRSIDRRHRRHRAVGAWARPYSLGRWDITIGDDMIPWAPDRSHLVGAAITMEQSAANLRDALQLPESAIRRLTRDNPRAAIGPDRPLPPGGL